MGWCLSCAPLRGAFPVIFLWALASVAVYVECLLFCFLFCISSSTFLSSGWFLFFLSLLWVLPLLPFFSLGVSSSSFLFCFFRFHSRKRFSCFLGGQKEAVLHPKESWFAIRRCSAACCYAKQHLGITRVRRSRSWGNTNPINTAEEMPFEAKRHPAEHFIGKQKKAPNPAKIVQLTNGRRFRFAVPPAEKSIWGNKGASVLPRRLSVWHLYHVDVR